MIDTDVRYSMHTIIMYIYGYLFDCNEVWTYTDSSPTGPETHSPPSWK